MDRTHAGILITKASGEVEPFDGKKLLRSLVRSGARGDDAAAVLREIEAFLFPGATTREIYRRAFRILKRHDRPSAIRYRLKQAILELGPSGYPFERYVGELLKHQGYRVQIGVTLQGRCVKHEVDVIAEADARRFMIECKFHGDARRKCDVKVPLYIQSRFIDLKAAWEAHPGSAELIHQGWIVTNTRFTEDAIQYGTCAGLFLIGWDYPLRSGLKDRIDASALHPLTSLVSLKKQEKRRLLDAGHVLARDLKDEGMLDVAGVEENRWRAILSEVELL